MFRHVKLLRAVSRALEAGTSPVLATAQLERSWCGDRDPEQLWAQLLAEGEQLMETLMQLLHTKEDTKEDAKEDTEEDALVLVHGDFHMGNIALSGVEGEEEALVFDLQCVRLGSGVEDIVQYLCQVTTPEMTPAVRLQHLQSYCDGFNTTVDTLLADGDRRQHRSPGWVQAECSRLRLWGLSYWVFITPQLLAGEAAALDQITEQMLEDGAEADTVVELLDRAGGRRMWWGVRRLMEMVTMDTWGSSKP